MELECELEPSKSIDETPSLFSTGLIHPSSPFKDPRLAARTQIGRKWVFLYGYLGGWVLPIYATAYLDIK
jgi:hypothetical protein